MNVLLRFRFCLSTCAMMRRGLLLAVFPLAAQGMSIAEAGGTMLAQPVSILALIVLVLACSVLLGLALLFLRQERRLRREMNARQEMRLDLDKQEQTFRFIAEHSTDVIWTLDVVSQRFSYISPSVFRLRGYTSEEVMAMPMTAALTPESAERVARALEEALGRWQAGEHASSIKALEIEQPHKDGHVIQTEVVSSLHADASGKLFVLGVTRDITERKKNEIFMRNLAFYDPLTMLPNRRLLLDRLQQAIYKARREQGRVALLFMDLDKFKPVNDELGHQVGDWLLQQVAERMRACVRESDTVARIGGDEFVIVLPDIAEEAEAMVVADKIRQRLEQVFVTDAGELLEISVSIGLVLYPEHGQDEHQLLKRGDDAMYQAKQAGRNQVQVFRPLIGREVLEESLSVRFNWKAAYECGDHRIDSDHQRIFELANQLIAATIRRDEDPEASLVALDRLLNYTTQHFAREEMILADLGYEALVEHTGLHGALIVRALELKEAYAAGSLSVGQLLDFLSREIVSGHMIAEDSKFFPLIRKVEGVGRISIA